MPNIVSPEFRRFPRFEGIRYSRSDSIESDYHLWFDNSNLRTDANLVIGGATTFTGDITAGGNLIFSAAVSQIIPGATSLSIRNNANTRDNWIITDAGGITGVGQPGSGSGVAGTGYSFTTGAGTAGNAQGGDYIITLGTGTGTPHGATSSASGNFIVRVPGDSINSPGFMIDSYGIGIGSRPYVNASGFDAFSVFRSSPTPVGIQNSIAFSISTNWILTGNYASPGYLSTLDVGATTSVTGFNIGTYNCIHAEVDILNTGGTISNASGIETIASTQQGSTVAVTNVLGLQATGRVAGTGTGTLVSGVLGYVILNPSGGAVDANITTGGVFVARLQNNSSAATPGVIASGINFYAGLPTITASGVINQAYGLYVQAQFNTPANTSTTGGYFTYGTYLTLGNQGGNTSGTNTNYGLYITGNGGTAGGGGTVNNWAIRSDSTANSYLAASLTVNAGGIAIPAGNLLIGSALPTDAGKMVYLHGNSTTGTDQYGFFSFGTFSSAATSSGTAYYSQLRTIAASFVMANGYGVLIDSPVVGAASTFTAVSGITINNQGSASATTSYGLRILTQSGSGTNWAFLSNAGQHQFGSSTATLGFYGAAPVVQPIASADATNFVAGAGTTATSLSTWTGASGASAYTVGGIVTRLKALGLLAA